MRSTEILAAAQSLRVWSRRGTRAPHKPLLLLIALGRLQRGEPRLVSFREIEAPLRDLLREFGPPRKSHHPEFPFWHLRSDGLWSIESADSLKVRKSGNSPTITTLRDAPALGGFPEDIHSHLQARPALVRRVAETVIEEHFPASYHAEILRRVGLSWAVETGSVTKRRRDPAFPSEVLTAYEYRCAICGLDAQLSGRSVGLEAAHVWWHSHGGASSVENGVCLCPLHHRALDFGGLGITTDQRIVASAHLHGGKATAEYLLRYHGQELARPQSGYPPVAPESAAWHGREVFRQPARTM